MKFISMSRRFGVAECVLAGMAASRGDVVVYMDADLQDPPAVIPLMLDRWRHGADVVHAVRTRRPGDGLVKRLAARIAYRLIRSSAGFDLPVDAGDFKLLSRRAVGQLLRVTESDPYLRGLAVWLGFSQTFVSYERQRRHAGATHFPLLSKNPWKAFVVGITSFSFRPIYGCLVVALLGLILSGLLFWSSRPLLAALTFFWATTIGAIGTLGLYLIRIYKDVRGRPHYVIKSTAGIDVTELERTRPLAG